MCEGKGRSDDVCGGVLTSLPQRSVLIESSFFFFLSTRALFFVSGVRGGVRMKEPTRNSFLFVCKRCGEGLLQPYVCVFLPLPAVVWEVDVDLLLLCSKACTLLLQSLFLTVSLHSL
jgi:hypothetical protein